MILYEEIGGDCSQEIKFQCAETKESMFDIKLVSCTSFWAAGD